MTRFYRIEHLADLLVNGNALNLEEGPRVVTACGPVPWCDGNSGNEANRVKKTRRTTGQCRLSEEQIVASAPIRQAGGHNARPSDELIESAHICGAKKCPSRPSTYKLQSCDNGDGREIARPSTLTAAKNSVLPQAKMSIADCCQCALDICSVTMIISYTFLESSRSHGFTQRSVALNVCEESPTMKWTKGKTAGVVIVLLIVVAATVFLFAKSKTPRATFVFPSQHDLGPVDRTTPNNSLIGMAKSLEAGDSTNFVDSFVFTGPDELELKTALEQWVVATTKFRQTIRDTFGDKQAQETFFSVPLSVSPELFSQPDVTIHGDSATVNLFMHGGKGGRPIEFTKVNGEWKMKGFAPLLNANTAVLNKIFPDLTVALDQTATEILSGKYKTAIEAVRAVKEKVNY